MSLTGLYVFKTLAAKIETGKKVLRLHSFSATQINLVVCEEVSVEILGSLKSNMVAKLAVL